MFDHGISREGSLLDVAVDNAVIDKRGSYYSYGETRLGQGRENVKRFLTENADMAMEIENRAREAVGFEPLPVVKVEDEPEPQEAEAQGA